MDYIEHNHRASQILFADGDADERAFALLVFALSPRKRRGNKLSRRNLSEEDSGAKIVPNAEIAPIYMKGIATA